MVDSISIVGFFLLGAIGWITYKIFIWPYYVSPLRKIPGPPSESPIFGNIKSLVKSVDSTEPQLQWVRKYGNVIKYNGLFNKPTIFVVDPKIIQEMTSSDKAYDFFKSQNKLAIALLGNGLAFAEGHKRQRKMMNPAFSHSNIKEMVPTFIRVTSTLKGLIKNEINQGNSNINLTPYISKTTLDIIGSVGFSYEFNSLTSSNELAEAYDSVFNAPLNTLRVAVILLANYIPFIKDILIGTNVEFKNACAVISRVSKKLVEEKYKEAENGELKNKDLLSLLINTNKILPDEEKMTYEELKNQAIKKIFIYLFTGRRDIVNIKFIPLKFGGNLSNFYSAPDFNEVSSFCGMLWKLTGHETTSATTCWALYLLAQHPHEQDLLREELVKAIPDKSNFNLSYDEINSLEYLNCVIKETLRMCTPGTNLI
ncbi:cytochrome P450 [Rhizophagus irregularis]|uniref:Cytochrome P450 n=1 Tax=Rhizophagus irregularis TaxID=588596 RepID=A0A2I1FZ71_9GLOM|nr:cytochrome P450 [Rhizophagus irregularis]